MVSRPELPTSPESSSNHWKSFGLTREGEQRFGKVIFGPHLPAAFEANIAILNQLISTFIIQGDVVICRYRGEQTQSPVLAVAGTIGNEMVSAGSTLSIDDPERDEKVEFDPQAIRHTLAIDFDLIMAKARAASPDRKLVYEAQLIEAAIIKGLRHISWQEAQLITVLDILNITGFLPVVWQWLMLLGSAQEKTKSGIDAGIELFWLGVATGMYAWLLDILCRTELQAKGSQYAPKDLRGAMMRRAIPPVILRNSQRAAATAKSYVGYRQFLRPRTG